MSTSNKTAKTITDLALEWNKASDSANATYAAYITAKKKFTEVHVALDSMLSRLGLP